MVFDAKKIDTAIKSIKQISVAYFYSTEEFLLQNSVSKAIAALTDDEVGELNKIEAEALALDELEDAVTTISFFGGRRVFYLNNIEPSQLSDADVQRLCEILDKAENSLVIITTLFKDDKAKTTKKAKLLQNKAEEKGFAAELVKPSSAEMQSFVKNVAIELGATLANDAATALIERCGTDQLLLTNEIQKLAAAAEYGEITAKHVAALATKNIEADVFDMLRLINAGKAAAVFQKLDELIYLQNEPIAIAAALAGSFVDMYRVKCGVATGHTYSQVFKDMGYKGNDYRLKKAQQNAAAYTLRQLKYAVQLLAELDVNLKSSPVNSVVLLQTAIAELMAIKTR